MRYALLADIHANAAALDAVLAEVEQAGAVSLVLLGDYVGYYYEPTAVLSRLMAWPHVAIRGNHDAMLLAARTDPAVAHQAEQRYGSAVTTALETLSEREWSWLEALPVESRIVMGETKVLLCHGAPFDPDAYVYPDAPSDRLRRCRAVEGVDAVWMGHTHWPFLAPGTPWLLNPGSVGQPRDIGGIASWCLFDDESGAVSFRRTEFAADPLARAVRARDPLLPRHADILERGRVRA